MAKKDIKAALKGSLVKEEQAIKDRFEKAETLLAGKGSDSAAPFASGTEEKTKVKETAIANNNTPAELKVIRDSFTMPQADYDLITLLKKRSLVSGVNITKSEILRAGLKALEKMTDDEFLLKISSVDKIKTGRPKQIT